MPPSEHMIKLHEELLQRHKGLSKAAHGVKHDKGKPRVGLVMGGFPRALQSVSEVGTFGANKYSDDGWKEVEDGERRYTDAMLRHYLLECTGEDLDEESNLLHAAHLAWNALARLELQLIRMQRPRECDSGECDNSCESGC